MIIEEPKLIEIEEKPKLSLGEQLKRLKQEKNEREAALEVIRKQQQDE